MKYCSYVNTKQGSKSTGRYSNGNTLPLVQLPFGMTAFAPQTNNDTRWYYHPESRSLEGIRLTHQPSPWIADYGAFVFLPQNRLIAADAGRRWSGYRPEEAILTPYYLKTRFLRSRADFELAPTERCAVIKITFDEDIDNFLSVLPVKGNYSYRFASCGRLSLCYRLSTASQHHHNCNQKGNYPFHASTSSSSTTVDSSSLAALAFFFFAEIKTDATTTTAIAPITTGVVFIAEGS